MSSKPKKLNRKFDKKLLDKANKIIEKYEIVMSFVDGEYYGKGLEIPTAFGDGKTPDECMKNTREALASVVAFLLEKGEVVPAPASKGRRTEQVNVRLTVEEKAILGASSQSQGFRGLGDFLRAKALASHIA